MILFDEPTSALDPISTLKIEELIDELKRDFTIAIVTHNMQQAARCADQVAFFYLGELIEVAPAGAALHRAQAPEDPGIHHRPVRLRTRRGVEQMQEHTVRSYGEDLRRLRETIARMGGLAERQVADAALALVRRDTDLAAEVVQRDAAIDALEREIEAFCIRLLALRQPVGQDLRLIVAALKISHGLERIGDYARNAAKRAIVVGRAAARSAASTASSAWRAWCRRT